MVVTVHKFHKLVVVFLAGSALLFVPAASRAQVTPAAAPSQATPAKPGNPHCSVHVVDPTQKGSDCEKVIELVRNITRALADEDFETMSGYMDENCSCYCAHTGKLITGRDNIIADIKANVKAEERRLKVPAIGFTVDHPYANVTGDTATVNFVLVKEIGGDHPAKYKSSCTDVLIKRNGEWKKLLFRGEAYKQVK